MNRISSSESEISESESDSDTIINSDYLDKSGGESESDKDDLDHPTPVPSGHHPTPVPSGHHPTPGPSWIWSSNIIPVTPVPFCAFSGIKVNHSFSTEMDFFRVFFDDEIMHIIITETNAYQSMKNSPSTSTKTFEPVTQKEMFTFFCSNGSHEHCKKTKN